MSKVFVDATGCSGGSGGGAGGWVQALLQVSAGQTLYIYVGTFDFNGGGGAGYGGRGGGATDIRTISGDLTSRIIVAGGGGGNGWFEDDDHQKNGGAKMRMRLCIYIRTNLCLR